MVVAIQTLQSVGVFPEGLARQALAHCGDIEDRTHVVVPNRIGSNESEE
jgi:hypothetical protein